MDEAMDDAMQRAVTGPIDDAMELVPGTLVMNPRHAMIEKDSLFESMIHYDTTSSPIPNPSPSSESVYANRNGSAEDSDVEYSSDEEEEDDDDTEIHDLDEGEFPDLLKLGTKERENLNQGGFFIAQHAVSAKLYHQPAPSLRISTLKPKPRDRGRAESEESAWDKILLRGMEEIQQCDGPLLGGTRGELSKRRD